MIQQTFGDPRERLPALEASAVAIILAAIATHKPRAIRVMVSGGKDSTATSLVADEAMPGLKRCHVSTGIGIPETRQFIEDLCASRSWPLEVRETPPSVYEWWVERFGFPGRGMHSFVYRWLKERRIQDLQRDTRAEGDGPLMLITGVRIHESTKRMGYVEPEREDKGGDVVWVAPIWDWHGTDVFNYIEEKGAPLNPVSKLLGISGECLCGSFADPAERALLREFFPETDARLSYLEGIAKTAGKPCVWGEHPVQPRKERALDSFSPMCNNCLTQDPTEGMPVE